MMPTTTACHSRLKQTILWNRRISETIPKEDEEVTTYIRLAVLAGFGYLALTPVAAQEQTRTRTTEDWQTSESVRSMMKDLEKRSDKFEDKLDSALDRSGYDGTHMETLVQNWIDGLEDELDEMEEEFNDGDTDNFILHFENAMMLASSINRMMLRKDFVTHIEPEWNSLRDGLNHIATQMHRPVLPNVTVAVINVAPASTMAKPDVKDVLTRLEAHVDDFEDKFDKAVNSSTANMKDREMLFKNWAEEFEDAADDMLENYKEDDARDFQYDLERTLLIAEMINRMVERSAMGADTETSWKVVRADLNKVANTYGYPVIAGMISGN
jgi:hypothetical protein